MVKIKRKLIRKISMKPVASPNTGDMMGGSEVVGDRRAGYVEQIKRDMAVLKEDVGYRSPPGTKFYERRIASFREAIRLEFPARGALAGKPTHTPHPKVWVRLKRKSR